MADAEDEAKVGGAGEEGETRRFWVGLLYWLWFCGCSVDSLMQHCRMSSMGSLVG